MGWDSSDNWKTKKDIVSYITSSNRFIDSKLVGNELWTIEQSSKDVLIRVFVLEKQGGSWAYKCMSESEHLFYFKCPKEFLAIAPVKNQKWRDCL